MSGILVIDDHPIVAEACRLLLGATGVENILVAHDAVSGYQAFLQHKPDVIIVGLSLHEEKLGGIALIERIRSQDPSAKILVFTIHADLSILFSAIQAGATGLPRQRCSSGRAGKSGASGSVRPPLHRRPTCPQVGVSQQRPYPQGKTGTCFINGGHVVCQHRPSTGD